MNIKLLLIFLLSALLLSSCKNDSRSSKNEIQENENSDSISTQSKVNVEVSNESVIEEVEVEKVYETLSIGNQNWMSENLTLQNLQMERK